MSEWITDRRPTKDDADGENCVLVSIVSGVYFRAWTGVEDGEAWMRTPAPPEPEPEPEPEPVRGWVNVYDDRQKVTLVGRLHETKVAAVTASRLGGRQVEIREVGEAETREREALEKDLQSWKTRAKRNLDNLYEAQRNAQSLGTKYDDEKQRRVYYQNICYAVAVHFDRIRATPCTVGTVDDQSDDVPIVAMQIVDEIETMRELITQTASTLRRWADNTSQTVWLHGERDEVSNIAKTLLLELAAKLENGNAIDGGENENSEN